MPKFAQKRGKFNILVDLGINTHYQYKAFTQPKYAVVVGAFLFRHFGTSDGNCKDKIEDTLPRKKRKF